MFMCQFDDEMKCKFVLSVKHHLRQCKKLKESQDVATCKLRNIEYKKLCIENDICSHRKSTKMKVSVKKR